MSTATPETPTHFQIGMNTFTAEIVAAAITVPLKMLNFSRFDNAHDALDEVKKITTECLPDQTALTTYCGSELVAKLNEDTPVAIYEVYRSLSPLAPKADALTLKATEGKGIFLCCLPSYGARTLVNLFVATYIDTIIDEVKRFDTDGHVSNVLKNEPRRFPLTLSAILMASLGRTDYDLSLAA